MYYSYEYIQNVLGVLCLSLCFAYSVSNNFFSTFFHTFHTYFLLPLVKLLFAGCSGFMQDPRNQPVDRYLPRSHPHPLSCDF